MLSAVHVDAMLSRLENLRAFASVHKEDVAFAQKLIYDVADDEVLKCF